MARRLPKLDHVVEHYAAKVNRRKLGKSAIVKFSAARKASA